MKRDTAGEEKDRERQGKSRTTNAHSTQRSNIKRRRLVQLEHDALQARRPRHTENTQKPEVSGVWMAPRLNRTLQWTNRTQTQAHSRSLQEHSFSQKNFEAEAQKPAAPVSADYSVSLPGTFICQIVSATSTQYWFALGDAGSMAHSEVKRRQYATACFNYVCLFYSSADRAISSCCSLQCA